MAFHPDDILTKVFTRKVVGGFNPSEVTHFLKSIAEDVDQRNKDKQALRDKLSEMEVFVREYRDREELLKSTILSVQKMADKIKQDAEKEARFILEDAHQKADLLIADARDSLKTAYQDLSDLRRMHIQLKNALKAVLQSHQDLLEQDPFHSILPTSLSGQRADIPLMEKKMMESLGQAAQMSTQAFSKHGVKNDNVGTVDSQQNISSKSKAQQKHSSLEI